MLTGDSGFLLFKSSSIVYLALCLAISLRISAPLLRASSTLPTMRKADSGRSSCLPSRISLNERIVS